MTQNVEGIKKAAEDSHARFLKSVQNIKKVCSNYFSKYETDLDEQKIRIQNL